MGSTYASCLGLALVFTLRAIDAHRMIGMQVHPGRVLVNDGAQGEHQRKAKEGRIGSAHRRCV